MKSKKLCLVLTLIILVLVGGGILWYSNNTSKVFMGSTGLPVVYINTPDKKDINNREEWMNDVEISIYDAKGNLLYQDDKLKIRGRGNTTWRGNNISWIGRRRKNPYALKLSSKESLLGLPKNTRWVLLANYFDRTLLRNDVAFHIASLTNLKWTPKGVFVELIINGEHQGNYYLCEQIRVGKNRVAIEKMSANDISGYSLTGGYLMVLDKKYDRKYKFKSSLGMPYMFKNPDEELQKEQYDYFRSYVDTIETIFSTDSLLLTHKYNEYIDVESFVDWWIVNELVESIEAKHPKSVYMYKDRGDKLAMGPVWDYDMATFSPERVYRFECIDDLYFPYLFKDSYFINCVKSRWRTLYDSFLTIPDYIKSKAEMLRESNKIDKDMWPGPYGYRYGLIRKKIEANQDVDMNYDEAIENMIQTFIQRVEWMDREINKME